MPRGDIDRFELATITTTAIESIYTRTEDLRDHVRPVRQQLVQIDVRLVGSILIERERGIGFIRVAMRASSRRRILVGG